MAQWVMGLSDTRGRITLQLGADDAAVHRAHSLTLQLQTRLSF